MTTTTTRNPLHDPEIRRAYEEELLVAEATETLSALVDELGISQRELADRLKVSEGRISQILSGGRNLTLRSLAGLGWALGVKFDLAPMALSVEQRIGTPAINDPPPPAWLRGTPVAAMRWIGPRPNPHTARTRLPKAVGATPPTATAATREVAFAS